MNPDESRTSGLRRAIIDGDRTLVTDAIADALAVGEAPLVLVDAMQQAMDRVGVLFENGALFLPEMYAAAQAVSAGSELLAPHFGPDQPVTNGKIILATVKSDIHDIGKNLVRIVLQAAGFEVVDLGVDVDAETIVDRAREENAGLVALSSLMTISMHEMERVIRMMRDAGLSERIHTIIGGSPISQRFADRIGADGYGENARSAVLLARKLLGRPRS